VSDCINERDIRVGNYLKSITTDYPCKVLGISPGPNGYTIMDQNGTVSPLTTRAQIPVTTELLAKNGFTNVAKIIDSKDFWVMEADKNSPRRLLFFVDFDHIHYSMGYNSYIIPLGVLKYLDQLQNIYFTYMRRELEVVI